MTHNLDSTSSESSASNNKDFEDCASDDASSGIKVSAHLSNDVPSYFGCINPKSRNQFGEAPMA